MSVEKLWPLVFLSLAMIVGAVIDGWKFKVPNWLTFPVIISGWLLGIYYAYIGESPYLADSSNRLGASLLCTMWGFFLLLPVYAIGGMGEGDVKLLMGFGSWVGAYFGINHGLWHLSYAFCLGVLVGGVIGFIQMLPRFKHHLQMARQIVREVATSKGDIGTVSDKAAERKPTMTLLPFGVPLTIGFVTYIWLREFALLPNFLNPFAP
jgi:prepilin peptidase CpaA